MDQSMLNLAIATVPAGRWAVAVSGGADSVALISLLHERRDLDLHVAHLNHELRGHESDDDARFVAALAGQMALPVEIGLRSVVEAHPSAEHRLARNPSSRYRAARLAFFAQVVAQYGLDGVIYAHHADDQAETVLHRLLRGRRWNGLCGMRSRTIIGGLVILRPLLNVPGEDLRRYLNLIQQPWREDSSNTSGKYLRNRLRQLLAERPECSGEMLRLASACREFRRWLSRRAPRLNEIFAARDLGDLPGIVATESARRWIRERGTVPGEAISPKSIELLRSMANDAATPARQQISKKLTIRRRRGLISAEIADI